MGQPYSSESSADSSGAAHDIKPTIHDMLDPLKPPFEVNMPFSRQVSEASTVASPRDHPLQGSIFVDRVHKKSPKFDATDAHYQVETLQKEDERQLAVSNARSYEGVDSIDPSLAHAIKASLDMASTL